MHISMPHLRACLTNFNAIIVIIEQLRCIIIQNKSYNVHLPYSGVTSGNPASLPYMQQQAYVLGEYQAGDKKSKQTPVQVQIGISWTQATCFQMILKYYSVFEHKQTLVRTYQTQTIVSLQLRLTDADDCFPSIRSVHRLQCHRALQPIQRTKRQINLTIARVNFQMLNQNRYLYTLSGKCIN